METAAFVDHILGASQKARDLLTAVRHALCDGAKIAKELADVRNRIIVLNEANADLTQRIEACQKRVASFESFEAETKSYKLKSIAPNSFAFAFAFEADGQNTEQGPLLCAHCFSQKRASILQFEKRETRYDTLSCPQCDARVKCENGVGLTVRSAPGSTGIPDF